MTLQRIRERRPPYRLREDVRAEPVRVGKYVYLLLLALVVLVVLHLSIGHLYLLRGDGFVVAPSEAVALEFDATVTHVEVSEGERVHAGQALLRYASTEVQRDLTTLALKITELERTLTDDRIRLVETEAHRRAAERYAGFAVSLETELQKLAARGLVASTQISAEAQRSFEAQESLVGYRAQREQLVNGIATVGESLQRVQAHYARFVQLYNDGAARARADGVVAGLEAAPGSVVRKGETVLRVYGDQRYVLAYLDERSLVRWAEGDRVLARLPGGEWTLGTIGHVTGIANRVPEEFQPRFKPTQRHRVVAVELDAGALRRAPILSKVSLYLPAGLQWLLGML